MSARVGLGIRLSLAAVFASFLGVHSASASDITVNCPVQSLQAAITALDVTGPHSITVNGTCEHAVIDQP